MQRENIEALRSLYEEFAQGNFWAGRDFFDPQIEWHWSSSMLGVAGGDTIYRGLPSVEAATRDWLQAWDRFWTDAEEFVEIGDQVVVFVRRRGRARGSQLEVETRGADVWKMREGKAVRYKAYDDRAEALEAVRAEADRPQK
jgi:ketosteroid isomerase-like protein